jgi:hypothetical protein
MLATAAMLAAAWAGSNALNGIGVAPVTVAKHASMGLVAGAVATPPAVDNYRFATPAPGVYWSNHKQHRSLSGCCYVNGREWVSSHDSCCPSGASAYGVHDDDDTRILVRVGNVQVGISPWKRIDAFGLRHLEDARNRWLHAHGFTGGVRTFRNDAYAPAHDHAHAHAEGEFSRLPAADERLEVRASPARETIQPRATITLPVETPRFRQRMRVDSGNCASPVIVVRRRAPFANQIADCDWRGNSGVITVRGEASASAGVIRVLPRETATSAPATRLAQAH